MAPSRPETRLTADAAEVSAQEVKGLIEAHCQGCHVESPAHPAFQAPPAGISLATLEQLKDHRDQVYQATVATEYMPLGNTTGITREERDRIGIWLRQVGSE